MVNTKVADDVPTEYKKVKEVYGNKFPTKKMVNEMKGRDGKRLTAKEKAKIRTYTEAEHNAVLDYLTYSHYMEMGPTVRAARGVREGQLKTEYKRLFDMKPRSQDTTKRARGLYLKSALDGRAVDLRSVTNKMSVLDAVKDYAKATDEGKRRRQMARHQDNPIEPIEGAKKSSGAGKQVKEGAKKGTKKSTKTGSSKSAGEEGTKTTRTQAEVDAVLKEGAKSKGQTVEELDEEIAHYQAREEVLKEEMNTFNKDLAEIRDKHFDGNMPTKKEQAETNAGEHYKDALAEFRERQTEIEQLEETLEELKAARAAKQLESVDAPSTPTGDTKLETGTPSIEFTVKKDVAPKKKQRGVDGAGAGAVTTQPSPVTPINIVPFDDTPPTATASEQVYDEEEGVPTVTATPATAPDPTVRDLHGETIESIDFGNVIPNSTDAEDIEDAIEDGKVEKNKPTMDVPMLPNPEVQSIEGAKAAGVEREEEQATETEIAETIRRDATRQTDTILTRQHQQAGGSVRDPNVPRVSGGSARVAARGQELSLEQRERVEQMYRNWLARPENAGVPNPYEPLLQALDVAQVGQDAANAADYEGGADDYANIINEGNVGAQGEGDPALSGGANTDYYYDLSAFEGGGQGGGAAPQVGQAVMSKLTSAQGAAADVSSGAMERAMQSKSVDQLKQDIQALCMLFASVIPALNSREIQTEKRRVMATSARVPVANFYRKLMQMVKQFYSSDDLKVGVIVSPQSMGGGGGGAGGLPGMGSAGYKMNAHGQIEPFSGVQRGDQFVNRGGRHYRDPVRSRVPLNLPEIRPKPVHLQRCMGFANVPFPNIKRAFTTGTTFTLKGASQRQAQMVDD